MKAVTIRIKGTQALLMHNERLANPMSEYAQKLAEVTKKRGKTLDDFRLISELEFSGGLYHSELIGPYIPDTWLLKCISDGAKKEKLGKMFRAAIFIHTEFNKLIYDGPRDVATLYAKQFYDQRCIGVNQSKTVRTRPRFAAGWECEFTLEFDETLVDLAAIRRAVEHAGRVEGIGDYRPKFGTFSLVSFK